MCNIYVCSYLICILIKILISVDKRKTMRRGRGRLFQSEGTAMGKALWWEPAAGDSRTGRPVRGIIVRQ